MLEDLVHFGIYQYKNVCRQVCGVVITYNDGYQNCSFFAPRTLVITLDKTYIQKVA